MSFSSRIADALQVLVHGRCANTRAPVPLPPPADVAAPQPALADSMDTRPLWKEAGEKGWLGPTAGGGRPRMQELSPQARADLVHLLEGLQRCGLAFTSAVAVPPALQGVTADEVTRQLLQPSGPQASLAVTGVESAPRELATLRDVRILDALWGTGNLEGFAHAPLVLSLNHLSSLGMTVALGKSGAPQQAAGLYAACRRYEGEHRDHDYSSLHFVERATGAEAGQEFYEQGVVEAVFFDHDGPAEAMGTKAPQARLLRELERRGCRFHGVTHDWQKREEARPVTVREAWKRMNESWPLPVWIEFPGAPAWSKTTMSSLHGASSFCTDIVGPMLHQGTMAPREASSLLVAFHGQPRGWGEDESRDLLERIGQRVDLSPWRAWPFQTESLRMSGWAYDVTARALGVEPRLRDHLDGWIDFVVAMGPHDAEQRLPSLLGQVAESAMSADAWGSHLDLRLAAASGPALPYLETTLRGPGVTPAQGDHRALLLAHLVRLGDGGAPPHERLQVACADLAHASAHCLDGETMESSSERLLLVKDAMRGREPEEIREVFVAATNAQVAGARSWDEIQVILHRGIVLGSSSAALCKAIRAEPASGAAAPPSTVQVDDGSVTINGLRIPRRA